MGNKVPSEHQGETCHVCRARLQPCTSFDNVRQRTQYGYACFDFNNGDYFRFSDHGGTYYCRRCFANEFDPSIQRAKKEAVEKRAKAEREQKEKQAKAEREQKEKQAKAEREQKEKQAKAEREQKEKQAKAEREQKEKQAKAEREQKEKQAKAEREQKEKEQAERVKQQEEHFNAYCQKKQDERIREQMGKEKEKRRMVVKAPPDEDGSAGEGMVQVFQYPTDGLEPWVCSEEDLNIEDAMALLKYMNTNPKVIDELQKSQAKQLNQLWPEIFNICHNDPTKVSQYVLIALQLYFLRSLLEKETESTKQAKLDSESLLKNIALSVCGPIEMVKLTECVYDMCLGQPRGENSEAGLERFGFEKGSSTYLRLKVTYLLLLSSFRNRERRQCIPWEKKAYEEFLRAALPSSARGIEAVLMHILAEGLWLPAELVDILPPLIDNFSDDPNNITAVLDFILSLRFEGLAFIEEPIEKSDVKHSETHEIRFYLETKDRTGLLTALKRVRNNEREKSVESLCRELEKDFDPKDLNRCKKIVRAVLQNIKIGVNQEVSKLNEISPIRSLNDAQIISILTSLSQHVHKVKGYTPRATQLLSTVVLILTKASGGRMVEIATGEGKSCIIAMFSALLALSGQDVDIVTSSPVLAARDHEDWALFYQNVGLTASDNVQALDHNTKKECYECKIIYGTVASFAADILTHEFMRDKVRGTRGTDAIIVDEIDFMLLDQGVQFTYLSNPTIGLHHLEVLFGMIWSMSSKYTAFPLGDKKVHLGPAKLFHGTIAEAVGVDDPEVLLAKAEEEGILEHALVEALTSESEAEKKANICEGLENGKIVEILEMLNKELEDMTLRAYEIKERKLVLIYEDEDSSEKPMADLVLLGNGITCEIHHDEDHLKSAIEEKVKSIIKENVDAMNADNESFKFPTFLMEFACNRMEHWVENAFLASEMQENRNYLIENGNVLPIDYQSTGVVEKNKKWSEGLQQFVEVKHRLPMSPSTMVTNFMSNLEFFKRYKGNVYGVTGTLGSDTDKAFLAGEYGVDFCAMPTHRIRKLYERAGLLTESPAEWLQQIKEVIMSEVYVDSQSTGKGSRAALVICEDIKTAENIYDFLTEDQPNEQHTVSLYTRTEGGGKVDEKNRKVADIDGHKLAPGEVFVATNLAGRGTDVKIEDLVRDAGGLFVLVSYLPDNTRIEQQAFGRAGRKGLPGSAQIILNVNQLDNVYNGHKGSMDRIKYVRSKMEETRVRDMVASEVTETKLKEALFAMYNKMLDREYKVIKEREVYERETRHTNLLSRTTHEEPGKEYKGILHWDQDEKDLAIESLHESWGFWLLMNSEKIEEGKKEELEASLRQLVDDSKKKILEKKSPTSNFYTVTRLANESMFSKRYFRAIELFDRAIGMDSDWTCIAQYNKAYCLLQQGGDDYMKKAKVCLAKAKELIGTNVSEVSTTSSALQSGKSCESNDRGLDDSMSLKSVVLDYFGRKIQEAEKKVKDIDDEGEKAEAVWSDTMSMIPKDEDGVHDVQNEIVELWKQGLVYVYDVKKKPRFCWEALLVALIGAFQVIAGALISTFSCGLLSSFGVGMMKQGISDIKDGVVGMIKGTFSWLEWGIKKAISIVTSIICFGISCISKAITVAGTGVKEMTGNIVKTGVAKSFKDSMKRVAQAVTMELAKEATNAITDATLGILNEQLLDGIAKTIRKDYHPLMQKMMEGDDMKLKIQSHVRYSLHGEKWPDKAPDGEIAKSIQNGTREVFKECARSCLHKHTQDPQWRQSLEQVVGGVANSLGKEVAKWYGRASTAASLIEGGVMMQKIKDSFPGELKKETDDYFTDGQIKTDTEIHVWESLDKVGSNIADDLTALFCDEYVNYAYGKIGKPFVDIAKSKRDDLYKTHVFDIDSLANKTYNRQNAGGKAMEEFKSTNSYQRQNAGGEAMEEVEYTDPYRRKTEGGKAKEEYEGGPCSDETAGKKALGLFESPCSEETEPAGKKALGLFESPYSEETEPAGKTSLGEFDKGNDSMRRERMSIAELGYYS